MVDFCNGHADDAGVTCQDRKTGTRVSFSLVFDWFICIGCESGTIRLVNGNVPHEGRVEVCRDDAWGTVCDDFWSEEDARVACRWAGFSAISMSFSHFF